MINWEEVDGASRAVIDDYIRNLEGDYNRLERRWGRARYAWDVEKVRLNKDRIDLMHTISGLRHKIEWLESKLFIFNS